MSYRRIADILIHVLWDRNLFTFISVSYLIFTLNSQALPVDTEEPLNIENTMWANTVVANGTALGAVIYTGRETRSSMNTSDAPSKVLYYYIIIYTLHYYTTILCNIIKKYIIHYRLYIIDYTLYIMQYYIT